MAAKIMTSREFNQDVSRAKRLAMNGPVFITDRGRRAHVLLAIKDYEKLSATRETIVDLLSMPEAGSIAFEPVQLSKKLFHPEKFK